MSFAAMPASQAPRPAEQRTPSGLPGQETVLWSGRTHWKVLAGPALLQILLIAAHVALARFWPASTGYAWLDSWGQLIFHGVIAALEIWYVLGPVLNWTHSTYTVTNIRVTKRWGVLYKHSREIPVTRIVSVAVERGILDRIFGCGTLVFHDAAASAQPQTHGAWNQGPNAGQESGVRFHDVPGVFNVQRIVDGARYGNAAHN